MMRKIIAALLTGALVVALGGCGQEAADKSSARKEITIGTMPDVDSIPFIIAQEKGFFKEEGLTVHIKPFKSAMDRDSALQGGNLDGAVSDMLAVAFAKAGGFDVKITSLTSGSYKLIAGSGTDGAGLRALAGKDVAVSKNTIIEYVTDKILAESGMAEDSIHKVVIPQIPARLEMLGSGKLAAATLPEPMASVAVAKGGKLINSSEQLGINPGVMMFTAEAAKEKREELKALYRAYNKAVLFLEKESRDSYMDLVIEKGGFPPEARDALTLPKYKKAQLPDQKDIDSCMEWLKAKKLVQKQYSYGDLVDGGLIG